MTLRAFQQGNIGIRVLQEKNYWVHPHVIEFRLEGMGDRGGETTPGGVGGGSPSSRGKKRYGRLKERGALVQTW